MDGGSAGHLCAVLGGALLAFGRFVFGIVAVVGGVLAGRDGFSVVTVLLIVVGLTGAVALARV